MNYHICLVGKQPAPVFYGVFHIYPENTTAKVILIASEQTKEIARRIKPLLINNNFECEIKQLEPYDIEDVTKQINTIKNKISAEDDLSINLVGGTTLWSLAFYRAFVDKPNTTFHLVDQNNNIINFATGETERIYMDIDTEEHLRLYGKKPSSYKPFDSYNNKDLENVIQIEIFRNKYPIIFKRLITAQQSQTNNLIGKEWHQSQVSDNTITWKKGYVSIKSRIKNIDQQFISPNIDKLFFCNNWFEVKIANLFFHWLKMKFVNDNDESIRKRIWLNTKFNTSLDSPKNEVDIIVNIGSKLILVECKTRLGQPVDIDKFRAVVNNYGGSSAKAVFITEAPINQTAIEKMKDNRILHFQFETNSTIDEKKSELAKLLDKEIDKINA